MKTNILVCVSGMVLLSSCGNQLPLQDVKIKSDVGTSMVTSYETKHMSITGKSLMTDGNYNAILLIKGMSEDTGLLTEMQVLSGIDAATNSSIDGCPITESLIVVNQDSTRKCAVNLTEPATNITACNLAVKTGDTVQVAAQRKIDGLTQCGYFLEMPVAKFESKTQEVTASPASNQVRCFGLEYNFWPVGHGCVGFFYETMVHITNVSGADINVVVKNSLLQLFRWQRATVKVGETFTYEIDTPFAQEWLVIESVNIGGATIDIPDTFRSVMFTTGGSYSWYVTPIDLSPVSNVGSVIEFFEQINRFFRLFG